MFVAHRDGNSARWCRMQMLQCKNKVVGGNLRGDGPPNQNMKNTTPIHFKLQVVSQFLIRHYLRKHSRNTLSHTHPYEWTCMHHTSTGSINIFGRLSLKVFLFIDMHYMQMHKFRKKQLTYNLSQNGEVYVAKCKYISLEKSKQHTTWAGTKKYT
jgi:hypothetical protein